MQTSLTVVQVIYTLVLHMHYKHGKKCAFYCSVASWQMSRVCSILGSWGFPLQSNPGTSNEQERRWKRKLHTFTAKHLQPAPHWDSLLAAVGKVTDHRVVILVQPASSINTPELDIDFIYFFVFELLFIYLTLNVIEAFLVPCGWKTPEISRMRLLHMNSNLAQHVFQILWI